MAQDTIRTVMLSSPDRKIIDLWLARQASPHTRACYGRDADRVIQKLRKPLKQIGLADLQRFADAGGFRPGTNFSIANYCCGAKSVRVLSPCWLPSAKPGVGIAAAGLRETSCRADSA